MTDFPFDRPGKDRTRLGTADAAMAAFPAVRVVVDAKGQAARRPSGWGEQKPFYSGTMRRHAIKNQVVCPQPGGSPRSAGRPPGGPTT